MKEWTTVFDNILESYNNIQVTTSLKSDKNIEFEEDLEENQIYVNFKKGYLEPMENQIHCYYPEKIIRYIFRNYQIIESTHDKSLWE